MNENNKQNNYSYWNLLSSWDIIGVNSNFDQSKSPKILCFPTIFGSSVSQTFNTGSAVGKTIAGV